MPQFLREFLAALSARIRPGIMILDQDEEEQYMMYCRSLRELHARLATLVPALQYDTLFFDLFGCHPDEAEILEIGRGRIRSGNATLAGIICSLDGHGIAADRDAR